MVFLMVYNGTYVHFHYENYLKYCNHLELKLELYTIFRHTHSRILVYPHGKYASPQHPDESYKPWSP